MSWGRLEGCCEAPDPVEVMPPSEQQRPWWGGVWGTGHTVKPSGTRLAGGSCGGERGRVRRTPGLKSWATRRKDLPLTTWEAWRKRVRGAGLSTAGLAVGCLGLGFRVEAQVEN